MANVVDILLRDSQLTPDQVSKLKFESLQTGSPVENLITSHGLVSEEILAKARSEAYNIPFINLATVDISRECLNLLDEKTAKNHSVLLFSIAEDGRANAAMADPLDIQSIRYLEQKLNKGIIPYFAVKEQLIYFIETKYGQQIESQVVQDLEQAKDAEIKVQASDVDDDISKIGNSLKTAPVVRIINTVLNFGIKAKASDIHIEPMRDRLRFRYRINGILVEKLAIPMSFAPSVVSRIKIMSKLKIDEKRIPQDGRFALKIGDTEVDVRVSTLPINYGEKIVMRLLKKTGGIAKLDQSGLRGMAYKSYMEALKATSGIILITGPTGSGKTQTLASSLSLVNSERVNIVTLEDPIEIVVDGINQVQVNNDAGLTFASGLRSFLRQDPNIIMVGEIRDQETARLATQAALTGHLVFSTIHTNSAAGALPRLLDMGIETFLIASTVDTIVAQRLVRVLCNDCKTVVPAADSVKIDIKRILQGVHEFDIDKYIERSAQSAAAHNVALQADPNKLYLYQQVGCTKCNNTGYTGRIGIFEVLKVTQKISQLILQQRSAEDIEKCAKDDGMLTMIQDGYCKVLDGLTTIEEVLRVIKD